MVKLITVTWSFKDSYNLENTFLYKSFIKKNDLKNLVHIHYNRNNYIKLEHDFQNKYSTQSEYILYKLYLTLDKIKDIEADHLIFCDANDVVCLGDINSIFFNNGVLFSSEANQYPSSLGDFGGLDYSLEEQTKKEYLNSGLFIADKVSYIELLENVINKILPTNIKSFCGDQGVFTYHYLSNQNPKIELDKSFSLFISTFSRDYNNFINFNFPMFIHDNGWDWGSPRFIEKFNLL